jgi:hypothetical protein
MNQHNYDGAAAAFRGVLTDLQTAPQFNADGPDAESRLRRGFREHLNYTFALGDPLQRVAENLQLYPAVARFVWMMSANNRLADIAFHVPKVADFTDDGLTVPGSSYGMRLRQPQPGLDQLLGAIGRLKSDKESRRAAVTIFQPMDAVRDSNDIPCAFGLFFYNRNGRLLTTVIMRSNNAFRLLPFNIFEFSMLAEVVAVESELQCGPITHMAGSMHLYQGDENPVAEFLASDKPSPTVMGPMPTEKLPLEEITKLAVFEAALRHGSAALNANTVANWLDRATRDLHPYWAQLAYVLVAGVAANIDQRTLELAKARVHLPLQPFLPPLKAGTPAPEQKSFPDLFGQDAESSKVVPFHRTALRNKFAALAEAHEMTTATPIGAARLLRAQSIVLDRLAARGEEDMLTPEAFQRALQDAG